MNTKVSTFQDNTLLENQQKELCKKLAIRFAVEELGWETDPVVFRWATPEENKAGKDAFVSTKGKAERGIDFKIRREGTSRYWRNGIPDIAVETSQASTYGWATKPNADPNTYIMFVFLDALKYPNLNLPAVRDLPLAIVLTLGTCHDLVDEQFASVKLHNTPLFAIKNANNGYGWSENLIVPITYLDDHLHTYWVMNNTNNQRCGVYC